MRHACLSTCSLALHPKRPMMNPARIDSVEQLDDLLSEPTDAAIDVMRRLEGDLILLGVGGKMGPTLARMAKKASTHAGIERRVIGVSRFSDAAARRKLESWGVETIQADLLDESAVQALPDAAHVIYMTGMKFGATGNASMTWAMNTHAPATAAKRYAGSRIAAFSTGNVYPLVPVTSGGSVESDPMQPLGEYAMSVMGRERIFEHFSRTAGTPMSLIRLNYACELRYGVLVDLAQKVWEEQPIDVSMGMFNVIWQADANAMALSSLGRCSSPPYVLNVSGPEMLSVRRVCEQFAQRMGKAVTFTGEESSHALLNNGQRGHQSFGYPRVPAQQMIDWIADWVERGGETLGKPTKFEVRDGQF